MASNLRVDSIVPATGSSVSIGTATGGVNIPGVLTYEDVTNVDSIGVITARSGIDASSNLILKTGGIERLRIQSDGDVGIGTINNTNNERLRVQDDASTSTVCQLSIISGSAERSILNFGDKEDPNIGRVSYHNNTNTLSLFTNNTERLRIKSDGTVNITPGGSLSGGDPPGDLNIVGTNFLTMTPNDNANPSDNEVLGQVSFLPYGAGSIAAASAKIEAVAESGQSGTANPTSMRFYTKPSSAGPGTSGAEVMKISSDGTVGVGQNGSGVINTRGKIEISVPFSDVSDNDGSADQGTNNHDAILINVSGVTAASGRNVGSIAWDTGGRRRAAIMAEYQNTDNDYMGLSFFTRGNDGDGDFFKSYIINHNGSASLHGSLSQNTSDDRLKKDKVEIQNALDKVNSLSSFTHKWNDIAVRAGLEENKIEIGLSAQEVQALYPSLVDVNNTMIDPDNPTTEYLTVHYEKVVPLLVASIKELKSEVEQIKSQINN